MSTPSESASSTPLPLRPALRFDAEEATSPKTGPTKVVSIAEPDPTSSPLSLEDSTRKHFAASVASKRVRPIMQASSASSRLSLQSNTSAEDMSDHYREGHERKYSHEQRTHQHDKLLLQVSEWLQREKAKCAAKKSKKRHSQEHPPAEGEAQAGESVERGAARHRSSSQASDASSISLESLQRIIDESIAGLTHGNEPHLAISGQSSRAMSSASGRRKSYVRKPHSSDTEYHDGDVVVPSCDVVLDNSKTMSYSGGGSDSSMQTITLSNSGKAEKEKKAWLSFKNEIVKLAHTLRLKGWRRVPLESGGDIEVERLSGALTNAVYVVAPQKELPSDPNNPEHKYKPPPKLLLRIYGPQVEHLIDRKVELSILRRLARKKIGPRLLGTFKNGRFEEFFHAQTLTYDDLRVPDTSKQIAKRMRELHDGIDLLEQEERQAGPFVWRNWDKWVGRCEEVITYLDKEILSGDKGKNEPWRTRGLVCGVEWKQFKTAVDNYRKWVNEWYDKEKGGVNRNLVFAHNDTQYGNILRLIPETQAGSAPSPLLLPQNTHKQLVVIDFEYACANTPGLEFANHFTEWCYNYHDPVKSWACDTTSYPTVEEQRRFIRSYLNHRPQFNPLASATPKMSPIDALPRNSISEFLLDSRSRGVSTPNPVESSYAEEEARRERALDLQVDELLKEVRIWRIANSAQWVAWGIVQAQVPELYVSKSADETEPAQILAGAEMCEAADEEEDVVPKIDSVKIAEDSAAAEAAGTEHEEHPDGEDGFDYLAYAQDRAMFFWGDVVGSGLVKKEELPEKLVSRLKTIDY
ncbi:choline kinase-like protein [Calycina marina]|uniref:Choline kinase-like protein n=1 Tax=Calycina marina TaxID=1763456 RepID=A0A9P7ZBW3_9HELO|nr:choline kinase-like protein [Calycina marina]